MALTVTRYTGSNTNIIQGIDNLYTVPANKVAKIVFNNGIDKDALMSNYLDVIYVQETSFSISNSLWNYGRNVISHDGNSNNYSLRFGLGDKFLMGSYSTSSTGTNYMTTILYDLGDGMVGCTGQGTSSTKTILFSDVKSMVVGEIREEPTAGEWYAISHPKEHILVTGQSVWIDSDASGLQAKWDFTVYEEDI